METETCGTQPVLVEYHANYDGFSLQHINTMQITNPSALHKYDNILSIRLILVHNID